jgi:2-keto-4-pentenoate hydratase
MDAKAVAEAAALLVAARRSGPLLDRLPERCRPATVADALRIQAATIAALGEPVAGWKVGPAIDGRTSYGALLATRVLRSGGAIAAHAVPLLGMEAEIAFRFVADVPPRDAPWRYGEIAERVVPFAALEIVDSRYRDYAGTPVVERVADFVSNGAFVVGDERPGFPLAQLAGLTATLAFDERIVVRQAGGHAAGDPLQPAVDLANALRFGDGLRAGHLVTTGTYTGLNFAQAGQRVRATFDGFGAAEVSLG